MNAEEKRLQESSKRKKHWKRWGLYLSERAWGTVREDYSPDGSAWDYFPHEHARSRAYRWNEDGIAGISDRHQKICFALAFWNGKDAILKERIFGLTGSEGNHGEDVKEYYVDDAEFIVKIPRGLKEVGVLLEPMTVVQKGIAQAFEIQKRLKVWKPKKAAVTGAGTIGLLATLVFKLKGMKVVTFGRTRKSYLNSDLIEELGAKYVSTEDVSVPEYAEQNGGFDVIFEATGFSPIVFDAMRALAKNGVLILSSVTGGDQRAEVPTDKINLEFVLGNKVMVGTVNANREYFESGAKDLAQAVLEYGDWLSRLLTHPVKGLENYEELFEKLTSAKGAIKVFCEVSE